MARTYRACHRPKPRRAARDVAKIGSFKSICIRVLRVRAIRRFTVRPVLPEPLQALGELAGNLRWSWHPETQDLFASVDASAWEASGHDPVRFLGAVPLARLDQLARDADFLRQLAAARADLEQYLTGERWYQRSASSETPLPASIGYFSPEFGITAVLPQYSGGLGILAGDHLKTASDLGVPIIGVGLLYRHGLLPAVAVARRLAAGDLPGPRPRRPPAVAAARGGRLGREDRDRPALGGVADRPHLGRPGRPRPAAAARLRRGGEQRGHPHRHRPPVRRQHRAPPAPGDAARHRRRARDPRLLPAHRRHRARGLPHQRGPRRLPRPRADPRAHRGHRPVLRGGPRGLPRRHGVHHAHAGPGRHRPLPARPRRAVLRRRQRLPRRPGRPDPVPRRRAVRRRRPGHVQHGGDGLPARAARQRRLAAARRRQPRHVRWPLAAVRRRRAADHLDHQRRARPHLGRPRDLRPGPHPRRAARPGPRRRQPAPGLRRRGQGPRQGDLGHQADPAPAARRRRPRPDEEVLEAARRRTGRGQVDRLGARRRTSSPSASPGACRRTSGSR